MTSGSSGEQAPSQPLGRAGPALPPGVVEENPLDPRLWPVSGVGDGEHPRPSPPPPGSLGVLNLWFHMVKQTPEWAAREVRCGGETPGLLRTSERALRPPPRLLPSSSPPPPPLPPPGSTSYPITLVWPSLASKTYGGAGSLGWGLCHPPTSAEAGVGGVRVPEGHGHKGKPLRLR